MEKFELIISPGKLERNYWRDLWRYRELFYFLAWRDILVRYKQTMIGIAWSIVRPLLTMIVFTIVFGKIAKLSSQGAPYPILVFCAMLPWQFFANSFIESSNSLIGNANLISKVYFPRLIIPSSAVIVSFVDFLISLAILAILMGFYRFTPSRQILCLPIFFFIIVLISFGSGLLVSALNVKYRDFRYIVPFIVQLGLYISPVGFSSDVVPEKWRLLYSINPMVGVIDGFRWAIIGGNYSVYWSGFALSLLFALVLVVFSFHYFRKAERFFADVI